MRGADLARLMVTLGIGLMLFEAANQLPSITGGADGLSGVTMWKLFGVFSFDLTGSTAYLYSLGVAVRAVRRRAPDRQLAVRPVAARRTRERAANAGDRRAGDATPDRDLHDQRGDGGRRRRPARADDAVRRTRRVRLSALGRPHDHGGARRRRPAVRRPGRRGGVHDRASLSCPTSIRSTGSSGSGSCWSSSCCSRAAASWGRIAALRERRRGTRR